MFLQHMLSVLRPEGMMATVMPHGVLFRSGEEKKIRTKIIEADLLEAVIGLPPNLFYGTGIPACIMVCRAKGAKPQERKDKILFINADRECFAGRAQNYLKPEHVEKIVAAFDAFKDIPGYAAEMALLLVHMPADQGRYDHDEARKAYIFWSGPDRIYSYS
jgi:type I restriction enzyme M protein